MQLIFKLLFFSFIASTALGQQPAQRRVSYTGDTFLDLCNEDRETCSHYIMGIVEGLQTINWWNETCTYFYVPQPVRNSELYEIITTTLQQTPKDVNGENPRRFSASSTIIRILSEKFPCP